VSQPRKKASRLDARTVRDGYKKKNLEAAKVILQRPALYDGALFAWAKRIIEREEKCTDIRTNSEAAEPRRAQ
jgi:hypothetical protein